MATAKGNFFQGTTMLDSGTHEDGKSVCSFLVSSIKMVGMQYVCGKCLHRYVCGYEEGVATARERAVLGQLHVLRNSRLES